MAMVSAGLQLLTKFPHHQIYLRAYKNGSKGAQTTCLRQLSQISR